MTMTWNERLAMRLFYRSARFLRLYTPKPCSVVAGVLERLGRRMWDIGKPK